MAVSGISGSRSIYGTRNVISGLASGMDTESMIENAISGYKSKISSLNQKRTKVVWQQEAYRSMISKMSSFLNKYMSYQSSNNLMSASFWNQSVNTVAKGANASKVTAVGKASSNVQIDRVLQLATAATYKASGSVLDRTTSAFGSDTVSAGASGTLDLEGDVEVSGLSGSLTLAYGGSNAQTKLKISFDDTTLYEGQMDENGNEISAEQALVNEINRQLESQSVTIGSTTYTGKDLTNNIVRAELKDGKITFADPKGNNVYVSSASGDAEALLGGKKTSSEYKDQVKELTLDSKVQDLLKTKKVNTLEYLEDKGAALNITVDGVSKAIRMPTASDLKDADGNLLTGDALNKRYLEVLQSRIDSAFGKGKLTVSDGDSSQAGIQFKFEAAKGSTFSVSSDQGKELGFGESGKVTSYLNTGKTLGELLGEDQLSQFATGQKDKDGNDLYSFKVNGVEIGQFTKNSTLDDVTNAMNNNSASGVSVSYSKITNELTFTAKETGAASQIKFDGLSAALFGDTSAEGANYSKGQNAIFEASVNGTSLGQMERSSNSVAIDGMTITLKGTFGYAADENGNTVHTSYAREDDRIVFTASNGQKFYGVPQDEQADGTVKTVKLYNEEGEEVKYGDKEILGKIDDFGNLTFYTEDGDGKKTELYLTKDDGFSEKAYSETWKKDAGRYVFNYGSKTLYGTKGEDGKMTLEDENGKPFVYLPSDKNSEYYKAKVYGEFDENSGGLKFYVDSNTGGERKEVYLRENGSVTVKQSQAAEVKAAVTRTAAYTADTTVTKWGTPETTEAVTFETTTDSDKIVDLIKQFVEDYNAMATEIKNAYSTLPAQKSNGQYYEPLTEDEEADATESFIKNWNEKAQQGILFGDSDLRNLYSMMTNAISMTGELGATLRSAGITVNYADGLSTLSFDEDKFRTALENNPDKVRDAFTASTSSGASEKGLLQALKVPLDMYGKTSGGKGILVEKAGSPLAASTLYSNDIQKQLNSIDTQIEKWQDLMSNKIDFYTRQFSKLEQLVQQMNSQSSYFSQLTGY